MLPVFHTLDPVLHPFPVSQIKILFVSTIVEQREGHHLVRGRFHPDSIPDVQNLVLAL
ncbi:MAG: hypothetical protein WC654_02035 [Patescibacteria group bacterium]